MSIYSSEREKFSRPAFFDTIILNVPRIREAMTSKKNQYNQFKGKELGTTDKQSPVSVKLSPEIDSIVRSLPNRSEFLR